MSNKPNHDPDDLISVFEVSDCGVLRPAGFQEPKTRRDIYHISTDSPAALAGDMQTCGPLAGLLLPLYEDERDALAVEIQSLVTAVRAARTDGEEASQALVQMEQSLEAKRRRLANMPAGCESSAADWIEGLERSSFDAGVVSAVELWLDEEPDRDAVPHRASGEGAAHSCLHGCKWNDLVGIELVDSFHPGDSTRAAILRCSIDEANEVARRHGLPVRFVEQKDTISTAVGRDLVRAYEETDYLVAARTPFVLRVRRASSPLEALHSAHGVRSSCFITACNPFSGPLTDERNAARQAALRAELQGAGLIHFEGAGQHPSNGWPPEPSFLVLGLDRVAARELGRRWEQNAIVWAGPEAIPELIVLR